MELLIFFLIFLVCMVLSILNNITMLLPLGIGFVLFTAAAVHRGFSLRQVLRLAADSLKESMIVVRILLLIGCLTGMWRLSGTVAYFVSAGISLIPPQLFILAAFLLSAAMSYALGTSFGGPSPCGGC